MDKEKLAEILKKARMAKGATMQEVADVIGVQTVSAYYRKEVGLLQLSLPEAFALARFYETTVDALFGDALLN